MSDLAHDVVKLPGWRWLSGMQTLPLSTLDLPDLPDLDDTATGGALLTLLQGRIEVTRYGLGGWHLSDVSHEVYADTLGRGCARLAYLRGHWRRDDSP